jgi:hypothetical protein
LRRRKSRLPERAARASTGASRLRALDAFEHPFFYAPAGLALLSDLVTASLAES